MNNYDLQYEELKTNLFNGPSIADLLNTNLKTEGSDSTENKRFELMVGLIKNIEVKLNHISQQNKKIEEEMNKNKTEINDTKKDILQIYTAVDSNKVKTNEIIGTVSEIRNTLNIHEDKLKNIIDDMNKLIKETDYKLEKYTLYLLF